jgi:tetratricopeptide (TPR) repeat protein
VQDEVVRSIVATLAQRVSAVEVERGKRRPFADMAVYDLILRAYHHMGSWTAADFLEAQELLLKAIALDTNCAQAHAALAWCCTTLTWFEGETDQPRKMALEAGRRALSLDSHCVDAHTGLGWCYLSSGEHAQALHHYKMALRLTPNSADTHIHLGYGYAQMGESKKGLDLIRLAMRLNPLPPDFYFETLGEALYLAGDYAAAIESFKRMSHLAPWTHGYLAACLAQMGRADEARAEVALFKDSAKEGYTPADYLQMELLLYGAASVKDH